MQFVLISTGKYQGARSFFISGFFFFLFLFEEAVCFYDMYFHFIFSVLYFHSSSLVKQDSGLMAFLKADFPSYVKIRRRLKLELKL